MVRGRRRRRLAVLVNRCAHRGTMVCPADRGHARTFTCPYHGWTYDLSGELLGVPYPGGYAALRQERARPARARRAWRAIAASSSRACAPTGISLAEHLGPATRLIDRSCDLSPGGRDRADRGLGEASLRGQLEDAARERQRRLPSRLRAPRAVQDGPHRSTSAWSATSARSRRWCATGATATSRSTGRPATRARSSGSAAPPARRSPTSWPRWSAATAPSSRAGASCEGPAHALIFPNLFLGETNIAIVQPVSVEECVHWHTPMFLKGVPEFNGRLLRMAEAGMGPASFLMPEDLIVAARNQLGLHARTVPVARARPGPQPRVRRRRGPRRSPTSPTRRPTARSGATTAR